MTFFTVIANITISDSYKLNISYKEARESIYWLKLLHATDYITKTEFDSLNNDAEELCKILGKILVTMKSKNK